jgi:hypothetical protein
MQPSSIRQVATRLAIGRHSARLHTPRPRGRRALHRGSRPRRQDPTARPHGAGSSARIPVQEQARRRSLARGCGRVPQSKLARLLGLLRNGCSIAVRRLLPTGDPVDASAGFGAPWLSAGDRGGRAQLGTSYDSAQTRPCAPERSGHAHGPHAAPDCGTSQRKHDTGPCSPSMARTPSSP